MAALLGARLLKRYRHLVKAEAVWCWSDSDNVLYWLRSEATLYSPFISSRKEQILSVTPSAYWRHVPTALNPADDLSRGIEASELTANHQCVMGPAFLLSGEDEWPQRLGGGMAQPQTLEIIRPVAVCEEVAVNAVIDTDAAANRPPPTVGELIGAATSLSELKRAVAELTGSIVAHGPEAAVGFQEMTVLSARGDLNH